MSENTYVSALKPLWSLFINWLHWNIIFFSTCKSGNIIWCKHVVYTGPIMERYCIYYHKYTTNVPYNMRLRCKRALFKRCHDLSALNWRVWCRVIVSCPLRTPNIKTIFPNLLFGIVLKTSEQFLLFRFKQNSFG